MGLVTDATIRARIRKLRAQEKKIAEARHKLENELEARDPILETLCFRPWRFANTTLHFDRLEYGRTKNRIISGFCRSSSSHDSSGDFVHIQNAAYEEWFEGKTLATAHSLRHYTSKRYASPEGLFYCPFSRSFWTPNRDREWAWWEENHVVDASKTVAETWDKLSAEHARLTERTAPFTIRHHPSITLARRYDGIKKEIESVRTSIDKSSREAVAMIEFLWPVKAGKTAVKKSIARHVRRHGRAISKSAITFFKLTAGAAAITRSSKT